MTKKEIIEVIAIETDTTKKNAEAAYNLVFENIYAGLKKNKSVLVPGFGTFKLTKRAARVGRNPRTGESIKISAR
jgi:DNA-binding protein HU-beta